MVLEKGPEDISRRAVQLDREIVRLSQEIQQRQGAGQSTRQLDLDLDRAQRQRGFLQFYVAKEDAFDRQEEHRSTTAPRKSSCLGWGCVVVLALVMVSGLVGSWLFLSGEPDAEFDGEPPAATVVVEPEPASPLSAPTGEPPALPRFHTTTSRTGVVTQVSGVALAAPGDRCWLTIAPHQTKHNCRIIVRCGGHILYGEANAGFNRCTVADGVPVAAHDRSATDGDPICQLDLRLHSVRISSDQAGVSFDVQIRLDDPARDAGADAALPPSATAAVSSRPAISNSAARQLPPPATASPGGTVPRPPAQPAPVPRRSRSEPIYGLD